jgi:hypothetical protein
MYWHPLPGFMWKNDFAQCAASGRVIISVSSGVRTGKRRETLEGKFSFGYLGDGNIQAVHDELEAKAEEIIAQYWPAIEALAQTLLGRDWEPKKPFESGTQWSESESAKYVTGEEVVDVLAGLGIMAQSVLFLC